MRVCFYLCLLLSLSLAAQSRSKASSTTSLQAQVKRLVKERNELKERLAAAESLEEDLADAKKSRDLAKEEAERAKSELEQLRSTFKENQGSGDSLLKDLQTARKELAQAKVDLDLLRKENEALKQKISTSVKEGDLVVLSEEIQPARPINLNRVTPRLKSSHLFGGRPKGVVIVNVLINEQGEVVASRLLQGLLGDSPEIKDANEACVDTAKRLIFDSARTKDGKTRVKVWQGVGFFLD